MIVATAVGRVFEHFAQAELTLPPDQLPWRSGPVVRGLRLLPVRYELHGDVPLRGARGSSGGAPEPPEKPRTVEREARGLLAGLRRLMFGSR